MSANEKSAPQGPHRAHAAVIVRSKGKSVKQAERGLTPESVKSYLPSEDALREAAAQLAQMGFTVHEARTHLNISGDPALFERVFHVKLTEKRDPILREQVSGERRVRFESNVPLTVPTALSNLVESIDLEPQVTFFNNATPPPLPYYHLRVPDDVALWMDAAKAHERGVTGRGIALAMVDTGFKTPFHPYYHGRGYTINPVNPYPGDAHPGDDSYGHGTGVAACALAVAPGVNFTVFKMGGSASEAFARAATARPHIITCSWGLQPPGHDTALKLAIHNAVADGIVVLFATGNHGPVGWPASEPAVISVGGVCAGDDGSLVASNYASSGTNRSNPGRQCPDVCGLVGMAPKGIYIALPTQPNSLIDKEFAGGSFPNGDETAANDGWVVASGTSSATPMVAGACALMMQNDRALVGNPAGVRATLVKACLRVNAGRSASGEPAGPATGAGLVQADRVVQATAR